MVLTMCYNGLDYRKLGIPVKGRKQELISTLRLHMGNRFQGERSGAEEKENTCSTISESVALKRKLRSREGSTEDNYFNSDAYGNEHGEKRVKQSTGQMIYESAMAIVGVAIPSEAIAVGDSLHHDIKGANVSRIESILITGGIHEDIVHSSCIHASYPTLCIRTLSTYTGPTITNRREIAQAAVKISLSHAQSVAKKLTTVRDSVVKKREKAALVDCVEMIGDSVDELSRTLGVLKHLHVSTKEFRWQMSNAETWASAALTDDDTCLDGFQGLDGEIKMEVKKWMTKVGRVTSNALYMINQLDEARGKPHP